MGGDLKRLIQAAASPRAGPPGAPARRAEAKTVSQASCAGHTPVLGPSLLAEL